MKLLFKTFIKKQVRPLVILTLLSFLVLLSIQLTVTVWSKHQTLQQRVDEINGAHMHVYLNSLARQDQLIHLINGYSDHTDTKITVETTRVFPYSDGDKPFDIYFEGYVSNQTNQYKLLYGKQLDQLVGNQVAISESYARKLRQDGIEPIGHIISYDQLIPNTFVSFEVVSIIDYPNFNDGFVFDQTLKEIPLFDYPIVSVGIANAETIAYWAQQAQINRVSINNQKYLVKITLDDYSRLQEEKLLTFLLNSFSLNSYDEKILPLYEISDYLSTNEQLYQILSLIFLGGFVLASSYTFVTYVKRQLLMSAKDIGLLMIVGIKQAKLNAILMVRLGVITIFSFLLFALVNGIFAWQIGSNRALASVFDVTPYIVGTSVLIALGYFFFIFMLYQLQLRRYLIYSFSSLKTKGKKFIKNPQVSKRWMPLVIAIKSLFAHVGFTLSSMLTMALLIFMLFVSLFSNQHINTMYNKETLGITFDYLVVDVVFADFAFTEEYASAQMMIEKYSNFYFVDIDYSEYYRSYYKSNFLMFLADMTPFVPIVEGTTPPDLRRNFFEQKGAFRYVVASRKHMDKTDGFVYNDENLIRTRQPERGYLFYLLPGDLEPSRETAANIYGTTNTLIDQGWVAYVYRDRQMIDVGFPTVGMYVFNVEPGVDRLHLEQQLDQRGVTYYRYDDILDKMSIANAQSHREILSLISIIAVALLLVLVINVLAFKMMITLENQEDEKLCAQMGVTINNIKKIKANRLLLLALGSSLLAMFALVIGYPIILDQILKAYGLYYTIALPEHFNYYLPLLSLVVFVVLMIVNISDNPKKKEVM